jgi:hypothetical protein
LLAALLVAGTLATGVAACGDGDSRPPSGPRFSNPTRITNAWLPISSTPRTELRGTKEGVKVRSVRTLLDRTKEFRVNGQLVKAVIVEDRAYENGKLHEVALDYYAQADDGTVYYLGEDVDIYAKAGKRVVSHDGAFLYGRDTETLGIAMPASPAPGERFTFERIPGVGSETNRVMARDARLSVPFGSFRGALRIGAHLLPENERETKWYGRGVGLLKEQGPTGSTRLVSVLEAGEQASSRASTPRFSNPTQITNPWLPISSLERTEWRGASEGVATRGVRRLLTETKAFRVNNKLVATVVVEERGYKDGKLHEVEKDYYAQSDAGTVYYLGEDVNVYNTAGTRVVAREGYHYGRDTKTLGVAMPARPRSGDRFTFERLPGGETETNRVVAVGVRVKVRFGTFRNALRIARCVLPDKERETKWYGRTAGLIKEKGAGGGNELVSLTRR